MKGINKAVALMCVSTFAAGATTVTFNGCNSTNNAYFNFTAQDDMISHIKKVSIKNNIHYGAAPVVVTLRIPGEYTHNNVNYTTHIDGKAFSNLAADPRLRIKIVFEQRNGRHVQFPTDCAQMFYKSTSITDIDLSGVEPNPNIETTEDMFFGCDNLENINFANFDTRNVTTMEGMFQYCYSLKRLDLRRFNTQRVRNMSKLFGACHNLKNLNISSFDTRNVRTMQSMFHGCDNLIELDLRRFNTSNVESMANMFNSCENLSKINLRNCNTNNVTNTSYMFSNCRALLVADLHNCNFNNVRYIENMFNKCFSLHYIYRGNLPPIPQALDDQNINSFSFNK